MKNTIVLAAVLAAALPAFAFQSSQGSRDVGAEVATRYKQGDSLEVIASAAKAVNVAVGVLAPELLLTGNSSDKVLAALLKAGYLATDAVNTLVSLGGDRAALNQVAINNGADPTSLLAATAAGGGAGGGGAFGSGGGFTGNSFSSSRAATIGGGGTKSVSGS